MTKATEKVNQIKALLKDDVQEAINLAQIARVNKWYIEVDTDVFAVGNKVIRRWWDNETEPLEAGEYELEGGEKMMVDSSGVITSIDKEVNLKLNKVDTKELEAKVAELEQEKTTLTADLESANEKIVTLSENKATEVKEDTPKVEEKETPTDVILAKLEAMETANKELADKVVELEKQPVREKEIKLEDMSFSERMMEQDKNYNK